MHAHAAKPSRVLIVEDEINTLRRLRDIVDAHPDLEVVGTAATLQEALTVLHSQTPDIVLTDIGLPDGSGIDLIRTITASAAPVQVMVITVFGDESHVIDAVKAGASGYLLKDDNPNDIVQAIDQMVKGGAPISPSIARYLLKYFHAGSVAEPQPTNQAPLTETEKRILQLVSKGYTAREIADMNQSAYYTVTTHVRNIYKKLSINSRAEAVMEAIKLGLVSKHLQ